RRGRGLRAGAPPPWGKIRRMKRVLSSLLVVGAAAVCAGAIERPDSSAWSPRAAAAYLDGRMDWWLQWSGSQRDHHTACVSCHTAMPYMVARSALRDALAEKGPSAPERRMLEHVVKRVRLWKDVDPWYPDQTRGLPKTSESRGTEAVFNALVLAARDAS